MSPFLFQSAVQAITPILLASLAGCICGRAGVFNLALEGQMLVGAFSGVVGSFFTHSAVGGVAAAMAGAGAFSLVLAYGATAFRGDPIVIGIGMNLLASGLTAYLLPVVFGVSGTFSDPAIVGLGRVSIPALQGVPVLGWGFGRQSAVTWAAWALTAGVSVVMFKTPVGLRLRGVGEDPEAARALGVDTARYRVITVLIAGALTGLAGAQLSLGAVSVFAEDMSAGRGWIAVVAVMLGRNNPLQAAGACVLFGFADALSINLQSQGLPTQLTDVSPYLATLAALVITHRRRSRISPR
ncbi:MAG: ABC transporter permease [Hyphomicrobiales bacterium]|nr:ABC transporter permease [Hyphomicrobiales bacterium]